MANANYCPPPIIYQKKPIPVIQPKELRTKVSKPVAEFTQAYKSQYSMTKAQIEQKKKEEALQKTLKVAPDQPNNIANFVVLNEKATSNLLKGEKINLQMNGKTLLDVFLNELAQLKREHETINSGAGAVNTAQEG
jgi:hypothetical protein